MVACYSLLVTRCLLLVAGCSFLVARSVSLVTDGYYLEGKTQQPATSFDYLNVNRLFEN